MMTTTTMMMTGVEIKKEMLECNIIYHLGQTLPIFLKIDFCEIGNYDFCILPICLVECCTILSVKEIMG